jgi:hypothetical protein
MFPLSGKPWQGRAPPRKGATGKNSQGLEHVMRQMIQECESDVDRIRLESFQAKICSFWREFGSCNNSASYASLQGRKHGDDSARAGRRELSNDAKGSECCGGDGLAA